MKNKERTILFYFLIENRVSEIEADREIQAKNIWPLIEYINGLNVKSRIMDLKDNKFTYLDSASEDDGIISIFFTSAVNKYRADLIDRYTATRRRNPKAVTEGESEKTHLIINFKDGEARIILERNPTGVNIHNFCEYLNKYNKLKNKKYPGYSYSANSLYDRNIFERKISTSNRVVSADIYISKRIIGSDNLNLSNRTSTIKKEVILQVKSEAKESIKDAIVDVFNLVNGGSRSEITRITAKARDKNDNEITIDTNSFEKKERANIETNQLTGEIITTNMFSKLKEYLSTFE